MGKNYLIVRWLISMLSKYDYPGSREYTAFVLCSLQDDDDNIRHFCPKSLNEQQKSTDSGTQYQGFNEGRNMQDGLTQLSRVMAGQKQTRKQLHKDTCTIPQMHSMHTPDISVQPYSRREAISAHLRLAAQAPHFKTISSKF